MRTRAAHDCLREASRTFSVYTTDHLVTVELHCGPFEKRNRPDSALSVWKVPKITENDENEREWAIFGSE